MPMPSMADSMTPHFLTRPAIPLLLSAAVAAGGELKVDINRDSKNSATETETGYTRWSTDTTGGAATGLNAITKSFTTLTGESVTVSFAQTALSQSRGGTGLLSNWYQIGAQGTAKLVSDGITVAPATLATGGEITMNITGLSAGHHTLLTYHNAWDAPSAVVSMSPMNVSVNGVLAVPNFTPSIRAATNSGAPVSYVEFDVAGPAAVTSILFAADPNSGNRRNVLINGFEIDTPNSTRIAQTPLPANGDEHVDADAGSVTHTWAAPQSGTVASYDFYSGTNEAAVRSAGRSAAEFLGNQTTLARVVAGINSHLSYYWRVDVVDAQGNVTRGTVWWWRPRHLAFPGAEGYGRYARGGRGGRVVEVNSLADYGSGATPVPGTLRYAVEVETGARTIVFNVSGIITLTRRMSLNVNTPYVTLAGQTAPGKGICLRQFPLGLSGAKDTIIRFLRNRPGNLSGETMDGGGLAGCDHSIMDHCSISWSIDEGFSSRNAKNITLQRTLISEALNIAGHQNYPAGTKHGYAASIGGDIASFHHNLLAHCEGRNWSLAGGLDAAGNFSGRLDIRNNVVYNWGGRSTDGGAHQVNFVNNYYRAGAATDYFHVLNAQYENFPGTQQYWFDGNVRWRNGTETTDQSALKTYSGTINGGYSPWVTAPFFPSHVTTQTAGDAFRHVLCDTGCNQPVLDDHDVRVVHESRDGTTTYTGSVSGDPGLPDSQTDVGGWEDYGSETRPVDFDTDHDGMPNVWEAAHGLDPAVANNNADPDNDGYTQLEDYLNYLAGPHSSTAKNSTVDISLAPFARGMTAPVLVVSAAVNGSVALLPDGGTARFTPAANFTGSAKFNFSATGHGVTVPQSMAVLVTAATALPPPEVHFESTAISGGMFSCSVNSQSGFNYQLQSSATLAAESWVNAGSALPGTGSPLAFAATAAPGRTFFRVVVAAQ